MSKRNCNVWNHVLLETTIKKLNVNRAAGETELHKAARLGYAYMVEQRLLEGANVDERDNAGWSALHEACAYDKISIVELLLRHGANPNCCSNSGIRFNPVFPNAPFLYHLKF